ncbi:MAG: phosphoglucomutase [Kosmotogales bacterium]|nr:phosphoglucomutase [Kosmotogales bacterium]
MRKKEETKKLYDLWLQKTSEKEREILNKMSSEEIEDSFYKDLEFGTGGMRGKMGYGTNRMNVHTITRATAGFGKWIKENYDDPSVSIAFDTRNNSFDFAVTCAKVLSALDVKVFLFSEPTATPILSYAVRNLKCSGGIIITASHNPPIYNGYKVYTSDGTQAVPRYAEEIIERIENEKFFDEYKEKEENISLVFNSVIENYMKDIYSEIEPIIDGKFEKERIVYSPLHGVGFKPVNKILKKIGFEVYNVLEQIIPDGNFPSVSYPNPEDKKAFDFGIKYSEMNDIPIVLATDPDSDRLGVTIRKNGEYIHLSGNQTGVIMANYLLEKFKKKDLLTNSHFIVKTIVSTPMIYKVAEKYNVKVYDTLTGFKYIGERIEKSETEGTGEYLFGFEESIGYLFGKHARDKDAIISSALLGIIYRDLKTKGKDLLDYLNDLYNEFGFYKEDLMNFVFEGIEGSRKIQSIMQMVKNNPLKNIFEMKLVKLIDYNAGIDDLPKSNVIELLFENDNKIIVRPSGTEPKIKFYLLANGENEDRVTGVLERMKIYVKEIIENEE